MLQAVERAVTAPLQPLVALQDVGPALPELLIFFKLEIGSKIFKKQQQHYRPNKTYFGEVYDLILTFHKLSQILLRMFVEQIPGTFE